MADYNIVFDDVAIAAIPKIDAGVIAAMDRAAAGAVQTMKFLCPVSPPGPKHRSGNLRSSIHAFRQPNGDITIGPTADYAEYVEFDTRPHIIESHGPWPLRTEWGRVLGRIVHHPGTHGQHFIQRTADSMNGQTYHA